MRFCVCVSLCRETIIQCRVFLCVSLCTKTRLYNTMCFFVCVSLCTEKIIQCHMLICFSVSVHRYKYIMSRVSLFVFLCVQRQVYNSVCFFVRVSVCQGKAGPQLDLCEALGVSVCMALTPIALCADEPHESSDCPFPRLKGYHRFSEQSSSLPLHQWPRNRCHKS